MHPHNQLRLPKRPRVEPMWADLGLEEMPSEMSSSGASSDECSELEGGWGSEMDATSCSSGDTESTSGGSGSYTGSYQSGELECSTKVSDNPYRKRRRGLGGGSLIEVQLGRSIPETHVTPTSHFFWWRRWQTRCCGSTRHAVDLSLEGKR